ncbi:hypothetical protein SDC9_145045 [bioreactor metagenome]|uniref:Uncharacterized protein n=1 Tax=bioreactor metagenome TaxID=1076179 RepID=A0A645E8R1_9ZZZZ
MDEKLACPGGRADDGVGGHGHILSFRPPDEGGILPYAGTDKHLGPGCPAEPEDASFKLTRGKFPHRRLIHVPHLFAG